MAHFIMFHQGNSNNFSLPDCGGGPQFDCPRSKRIAAEYRRGFFTLTNVLNPNLNGVEYCGSSYWQHRLADEVKVGDTLWFVLVPPKHKLLDVAAYGEATFAEGSSLASLGGLTADLVVGKYSAANANGQSTSTGGETTGTVAFPYANGQCTPTGVETKGTVAFPKGVDPEEIFVQADVNKVTKPKEWLSVGLKITALPTDAVSLAEIEARVAVVAHVMDYDAQIHL